MSAETKTAETKTTRPKFRDAFSEARSAEAAIAALDKEEAEELKDYPDSIHQRFAKRRMSLLVKLSDKAINMLVSGKTITEEAAELARAAKKSSGAAGAAANADEAHTETDAASA